MPRQLPWLNKGGGRPTQVKQLQKPATKARIPNDIDDDFFEGTGWEISRKGKEQAELQKSDDDLPKLSNPHSWASRKGKEPVRCSRQPSSSPPPPSATLPPPKIEYMRKGVDRFDLRDDEWMMVEDELLQTAKMFTRHLHLAEYERLKADMEERSKQPAARPVLPDANPSDEGRFKKKAEEQLKTQKKALKDIFTAASDRDAKDPNTRVGSEPKAITHKPRKDPVVQRSKPRHNKSASDSDDLDAPKRPPMPTSKTNSATSTIAESNPKSPQTKFIKPALPLNARARAKLRRPTPFDMWDDFTPNRHSSRPQASETSATRKPSSTSKAQKSLNESSSTLPSPHTTKPTGHSTDIFGDLDFPKRGGLSKETSDRLAKRKAEREKETPSKSRKRIDDIPTFLF
ncbi:hypothetical protein K458DRAFT_426477 [Lentithecium fluviatile CBS 122367]|uniref:Uncharacterized protein n=1 Tax=Lentithecium fluviatile CBS 122367 TaxID=1168545 RepID=A0A6G1JLS5_9PLEO|nr:hypothetical protein K458DRAFT_426477 [Lentithecium fluviatile CBS 122367]